MASFDFISFAPYSFNATFNAYLGPSLFQNAPGGEVFTLIDNEGDTTFEANEDLIELVTSVPFLPGIGEGTFVGTFTTNVELVVLQNGGQLFVYSPLASGATTWPSQLTLAQLDTNPLCFAAGTRIASPTGACKVEALRIGDMVLTHDGRETPVKWIGRQTISTRFCLAKRLQPVRIRTCALGDRLPHSDLTVTADHGMVLDWLVINASALVNGTTIDWVPMAELEDSFTVYHIETENHDVILANGAPAETFIDYVGRKAFDNYAEYVELYGAERIIPEMARPRISTQRLLPDPVRARFGIDVVVEDVALSA